MTRKCWNDAGQPVFLPPGKDTISFIDIRDRENPKVLTSIALENSIFGPPTNLAVSPNGEIALVANSMTQISGKDVKLADTVAMGDSVAHVAISPDGTKALAVKPVANKVAFLKIDGGKVRYEKYDMPTGIFPYNVDIVPGGHIALVANNGAGGAADGNVDTVSVIDLDASPPRVIDQVTVGDAPEGFAISPKGDLALAILVAGNSDKNAFFSRKNGSAAVLKIDGKKVTKVGDVELGALAEGVVFSPDGAYAYIGNFLDSDISILKIIGGQVTDTGKKIKVARSSGLAPRRSEVKGWDGKEACESGCPPAPTR